MSGALPFGGNGSNVNQRPTPGVPRPRIVLNSVPCHIRAEFLATDSCFALNRRAMVSRDAPAALPHAWRTRSDVDRRSQRNDAAGSIDRSLERVQSGGFGVHDCECKSLTFVMQGNVAITDVTPPLFTIAARLTDAREALGLSQTELAARAGVVPGTIGNIEAGTRKNPRELLAIAAALQVRPEWLKSGKGQRDAEAATKVAKSNDTDANQGNGAEWAKYQLLKWLPEEELEEIYARAARAKQRARENLKTLGIDIPDDAPEFTTITPGRRQGGDRRGTLQLGPNLGRRQQDEKTGSGS